MKFKDIKLGLFRYQGIVYTKISDTQAVMIVSGQIIDFDAETLVLEY